tara:strand:+ start:6224 stop:6628 length:405 start_codon:yes stop_codon:yes gene_type:complete
MNVNDIIKIQNKWRGYICKKRIKYFSKLPNDVWFMIIGKMRENERKFLVMETFMFKKLVLFTWSWPRRCLKQKLKLIRFVSEFSLFFEKKVVSQTLILCQRILLYCHNDVTKSYINACLEIIMNGCSSYNLPVS